MPKVVYDDLQKIDNFDGEIPQIKETTYVDFEAGNFILVEMEIPEALDTVEIDYQVINNFSKDKDKRRKVAVSYRPDKDKIICREIKLNQYGVSPDLQDIAHNTFYSFAVEKTKEEEDEEIEAMNTLVYLQEPYCVYGLYAFFEDNILKLFLARKTCHYYVRLSPYSKGIFYPSGLSHSSDQCFDGIKEKDD